ncbi:two-component sensor histidine kinase [Paenibacillus sp. CAA11]|uniref:sensor histidine kinase n=1 Tax=Paenibacillus sp. CAA11 TaxID=1532905 RepID=UPI000D39E719|nr:histidine kinase [Paenibacillus sp. CAA11]AWB45517.1 two-component sensor histidine kinase [Paenibacillus sp. CAA11]
MFKSNLFRKIVLLIIVMLIPIIALYFYANRTSSEVLRQELNQSNMNQLVFFQDQLSTRFDTLASWTNLLTHDPDIKSFQDIYLQDKQLNLDSINLIKRIQDKISLQQSSSNWKSKLYIYSPSLSRVVTERDAGYYRKEDIAVKHGWQVQPYQNGEETSYLFSWSATAPFLTAAQSENANTIIKVEFDSSNIQDMLDGFKTGGHRDPFYYNASLGVIFNRTADRPFIQKLIRQLQDKPMPEVENRTVRLRDQNYTVNIVKSQTTGWYMVDYLPLSEIMKPIGDSNRLFYYSIGALLLMSFLAAYLLYSQVQVPLKQLIYGFQRLKAGDYNFRINVKGNNEFSFLSLRFNSMVEQIQELFERVYLEQIHVKEARLKQLQSQINPHFFYNCFSFITSMAKLRKHEAVVAMSNSLSRYYRYTTRQERDLVPLEEELDFVKYYMEIQTMRMNRLVYDIDLPDKCRRMELPPLLIQPLVENAVLHGIEPQADKGVIRIFVSLEHQRMKVVVEDNGKGMTGEELLQLENRLSSPLDETMGCGLWNVQQRLRLRFGETAQLSFRKSELGGLGAMLTWDIDEKL